MAYIVHFNGINLSNYCDVLNVKRSILPNRSNFFKEVPAVHGSYYTGGKYSEKIIPIEVAIKANTKEEYAKKIEKLAQVLDVKKPAKLTINDEPYKNYYAIVDGTTELTKQFQNGVATINFLCNNPYAESEYWNTYRDNGNGIFDIVSYGTAETHPVIDVDFKSKGCFFQLTNYEGKTVLIGKPKDNTKITVPATDIVINDTCRDSSTFTSISDTLFDQDRTITGAYSVDHNVNGIVCSNYGTTQNGKWCGAGFKRNLGRSVSEFEVIVDLTFSSLGENYVKPVPAPPIPQPAPAPQPEQKPSPPVTNTPVTQSLGTYKVVNCGGLWINKTADVTQPLYAMSPGTHIYPTEIRNGWAKHTHSNQWNTFTGWSSMKYLQKVSDTRRTHSSLDDSSRTVRRKTYADEQLGLLEIYGFDRNGAKLFKMEVADSSSYYEFVEPKVSIGSSVVLKTSSSVPSPRTDEEGKGLASGVFGDFNDFIGQISIKREKNSAGVGLWSAEIRKIVDGRVVKTLKTSNGLSANSFPKGDLNYIGVFISRYGESEPVSIMAVNNIQVRNLNLKTDEYVNDNLAIFKNGDHMQIDFENGLVTLNNEALLSQIDIGSEFFTLPSGKSQFAFRSDATVNVVCGFKDRFI